MKKNELWELILVIISIIAVFVVLNFGVEMRYYFGVNGKTKTAALNECLIPKIKTPPAKASFEYEKILLYPCTQKYTECAYSYNAEYIYKLLNELGYSDEENKQVYYIFYPKEQLTAFYDKDNNLIFFESKNRYLCRYDKNGTFIETGIQGYQDNIYYYDKKKRLLAIQDGEYNSMRIYKKFRFSSKAGK